MTATPVGNERMLGAIARFFGPPSLLVTVYTPAKVAAAGAAVVGSPQMEVA